MHSMGTPQTTTTVRKRNRLVFRSGFPLFHLFAWWSTTESILAASSTLLMTCREFRTSRDRRQSNYKSLKQRLTKPGKQTSWSTSVQLVSRIQLSNIWSSQKPSWRLTRLARIW
jgi:hypothetical protein